MSTPARQCVDDFAFSRSGLETLDVPLLLQATFCWKTFVVSFRHEAGEIQTFPFRIQRLAQVDVRTTTETGESSTLKQAIVSCATRVQIPVLPSTMACSEADRFNSCCAAASNEEDGLLGGAPNWEVADSSHWRVHLGAAQSESFRLSQVQQSKGEGHPSLRSGFPPESFSK